jgi:hypothetical protein
MKLTIDNLQGQGPTDYTASLDGTVTPRVERKINQPAGMRCSLVNASAGFAVPVMGARIVLTKTSGELLFTGYLTQSPEFEHLGLGERGAEYRYNLSAESDEVLLDQKSLPNRAPFVGRSAGSALRQLVEDLLPGWLDTGRVQDVDTLASYTVNPQEKFSHHAAEIALAARASYRVMNGAVLLEPVGGTTHTINESDATFSPTGLSLCNPMRLVNDVTVIGLDEPQAYVRDYFVGDGMSRGFYLSQRPFLQNRQALIDEQYLGQELDAATWAESDPSSAVSLAAQAVKVSGGTGHGGPTRVTFIEQIELGGAMELQHGDVTFSGPSNGVLGGLYGGTISIAGCLAGFQIAPSGASCIIQALIKGSATGPVITTTAGHRYVLTTYLYSMEVYRSGQTYHSSAHPAGLGRGGVNVPADVRFVLEVQDINPLVPASRLAPATVLFDGVIPNAPGLSTYAVVNSSSMQCSIASTYVTHISLAEVRTAMPDLSYETRLVESISDGGECLIASSTSLDFYPQYVPPLNTLIVVSYRGYGRAVAEIVNDASIATLRSGADDGVRGMVRAIRSPSARTQTDCENAALAILDDAVGLAWMGTYQIWSDFLPGGSKDIFPGEAMAVNVPSQGALFGAIVRGVNIDVLDPAGDRAMYTIEFANELAAPLALHGKSGATIVPLQDIPVQLSTTQASGYYLTALTNAQVIEVSSTTVQVDAGMLPGTGFGIEVRASDRNWGAASDRNLLGRFNTQTFSLPRLGRTQTYFLRLYDNSSPVRYSRYAAALHVDYPL